MSEGATKKEPRVELAKNVTIEPITWTFEAYEVWFATASSYSSTNDPFAL